MTLPEFLKMLVFGTPGTGNLLPTALVLLQIEALFSSLFPNNKVQERYLNFLTFYFDYPDLISQLINSFDPLDFKMNVLIQDE